MEVSLFPTPELDLDLAEGLETRRCSCCRKTKLITEFNPNRTKKSGVQSYCKTCANCSARGVMKRRTNYVWLNQYKVSKGCFVCGYNDYGEALDAHHLRDKEFAISSRLDRSLDSIKAELEKCVILCAICHRLHHAGILNLATLKPTTTRE